MPSTKSVVLSCAGIGSRLGLGQTKALISIHGRPLIAWQLDCLREIEDIRIVIGYQAGEVVEEVLKYRRDIVFVYNHNYFDTKTGASFYLGARDANELVIGWDGDLLIHPADVKKCLEFDGEYIAYSEVSSDEAVFVKTAEHGEVLAFSNENGDYEWTGPACIRREKVQFTSGNMYNQLEKYLPMSGIKIRACDIDTYADYKRAIDFVASWDS